MNNSQYILTLKINSHDLAAGHVLTSNRGCGYEGGRRKAVVRWQVFYYFSSSFPLFFFFLLFPILGHGATWGKVVDRV